MHNGSFSDSSAFGIVKSVLVSVIFSFVAALVFSFALRFCALSDKIIRPVNIAIRTAAIFVGCMSALRGERGWLKGGASGVFTTMLTRLLFCAIAGDFSVSAALLIDLAFGFIAGAISGIVAVNVKR